MINFLRFDGMSECDKPKPFDAGSLEHSGACRAGCARCHDIIDENDIFSMKVFIDMESAVEIMHSVVVTQRGLMSGVSNSGEDVVTKAALNMRVVEHFMKSNGESPDGVKSAFPEAARVWRNGNQDGIRRKQRFKAFDMFAQSRENGLLSGIILVIFPLGNHALNGALISKDGASRIDVNQRGH